MTNPQTTEEKLRDIINRAFEFIPPMPSGSDVVWTERQQRKNRVVLDMIEVRHGRI